MTLLLLFIAGNAGAQCLSEVAVINRNAKYPGLKIEALTGQKALAYTDIFNDEPPASRLVSDEVLIFMDPHTPWAMVIFFKDHCAVLRINRSYGMLVYELIHAMDEGRPA